MDLDDDVHIVAAGLTAGRDALHRALQVVLTVAAADLVALGLDDLSKGLALQGSKDGVHLDGVITLGDGVAGHIIVLLRVIEQVQAVVGLDDLSPAELKLGGVGAQLVVGLAADQLVHGDVQSLALDIPAGNVDGRHGGGDHHAAAHAPEGVAVQVLPDLLGVEGIHADDQLGKVLALAEGGLGAVAVGQAGLAPAVDALVGVDLHGNKAAEGARTQVAFHARDFHVC